MTFDSNSHCQRVVSSTTRIKTVNVVSDMLTNICQRVVSSTTRIKTRKAWNHLVQRKVKE